MSSAAADGHATADTGSAAVAFCGPAGPPSRRKGSGGVVATRSECEQALRALIAQLHAVDPEVRKRYVLSRSLALRIPDLQVVFFASLEGDAVEDLRCVEGEDDRQAQVRVCADSDDLLDLLDGRLALAVAWATGKLKVEASMLDLLKLRSLL